MTTFQLRYMFDYYLPEQKSAGGQTPNFDEENYGKYYQRYLVLLKKLEEHKLWSQRLLCYQAVLTWKCQ
jgi:hypothetical protein